MFAFAGTPTFFPIVSEKRDPRYYARSVLLCQSVITLTYITTGIVVYYYADSYVASPTLRSARALLKEIAYGFALPGLAVKIAICTHLPAKYIFVRLLRGTPHFTESTITHWVV